MKLVLYREDNMDSMDNIIQYIDVGQDDFIQKSAFDTRKQLVDLQQKTTARAEVSIIIVHFKQLDKTKKCIRAILDNTVNHDYELIILNNTPEDGSNEYFMTIDCPKKRIISFTRNIGFSGIFAFLNLSTLGRYIAVIPNDVIVTPSWLDNLVKCIESNIHIGMVTPASSNTMGLQGYNPCQVDAPYEVIQECGRRYNSYNPSLWEERCVLVTPATLYRKEAVFASGWPMHDVGALFGSDFHRSIRIRRVGYKIILARDTWVHHQHDYAPQAKLTGLIGKSQSEMDIWNQYEKEILGGIEFVNDVYNFILPKLEKMPIKGCKENGSSIKILGIDVRCGQPILDIKNRLRRDNVLQTISYGFTQEDKYMPDLKSICGLNNAYCDREEFFRDYFNSEIFDYIVVDRPINQYKEPVKFYRDVLHSLKQGGILFISLLNTQTYIDFLSMAVDKNAVSDSIAVHIPVERFINLLNMDVEIIQTFYEANTIEPKELLSQAINGICQPDVKEDLVNRMLVNKYIFMVRKKYKSN